MTGRQIIRAAESALQPFQPRAHIFGRGTGGGRTAEDHGLGTAFGFDGGQFVGNGPESLVPRDRFPARIGIALRPGAPHRLAQTVRRIDHFGRRRSLDADAAIGMIGIRRHFGEDVILDSRDYAAARCAHGAVGGNFLGSHSCAVPSWVQPPDLPVGRLYSASTDLM